MHLVTGLWAWVAPPPDCENIIRADRKADSTETQPTMSFLSQAAAYTQSRRNPADDVQDQEEDLQRPLLEPHSQPGASSRRQQRPQPHTRGATPAAASAHPVDLGWVFACRLWRILLVVKGAAPAALLAGMAVSEAVIVSRVGTISSAFYQAFVDGQQGAVARLMLWSGGCYVATTLFYTMKSGLLDFLAWRWRAALTLHVQQLYCSNLAFYSLQGIDNPDQRLSQDLPLLTSSLAGTLAVLAAVPFNILWYTQLTRQVFGSWVPVAAAYLFFAVGLLLQRLAMMPVASMVFDQEAAEGYFRFKQMRFRAWAHEIALYRSAPVEQAQLELALSQVLACQGRLLLRRAALTAATKLLEYGGLVVNFGCLALAVFGGAWDADRATPGGMAAKVSVASFYLLTLIYSFTQMLDLADKVSSLAGLTARVSQLLEELQQRQQPHTSQQQQQQQPHTTQRQPPPLLTQHTLHKKQQLREQQQEHEQQQQQQLLLLGDGMAPSHKRYASQAVMLQAPQLVRVRRPCSSEQGTAHNQRQQQKQQQQIEPAGQVAAQHDVAPEQQQPQQPQQPEGQMFEPATPQQQQQQEEEEEVMQVSIHSLGADVLMHEVRRAFPDSPRLAPLTAVVTFQFCGIAKQLMLQKKQQQQQQQWAALPSPHWADSSSGSSNSLQVAHTMLDGSQPRQQQSAPNACCQRAASVPVSSSLTEVHGWDAIADSRSSSSAHTAARAAVAPDAAGGGSCPCGGDAADCSCLCSGPEMQAMLAVFLAWQKEVCSFIAARGYWADALDPRTGRAMRGRPGQPYNEVVGAQVLLGYATQQQQPGSLTLINHPAAGTQVYPATLFTSAPLQLVKEALRAAAAAAPAASTSTSTSTSSSRGSTQQQQQLQQQALADPCTAPASSGSSSRSSMLRLSSPVAAAATAAASDTTAAPRQLQLLACKNLCVSTPSGLRIVRDLSLSLTAASRSSEVASLLIRGPSGCGKSTLLRCLAGLWPADSGRFSLPAGSAARGVMFLPQRMLAAPGHTLREQLAYPADGWAFACCCTGTKCSGIGSSSSVKSSRRRLFSSSKHSSPTSAAASAGGVLGGHEAVRLPPGGVSAASKQYQQPVHVQLATWWDDWLSCGIKQGARQQQQQQQQCTVPSQQQQQEHQKQQDVAVAAASAPGVDSVQRCSACQQLLAALRLAGLSYLLAVLPAGLDSAAEDWGALLSPGEMQRLGFARVLLHRPLLAVLDEATSSLPGEVAVQLYQQLQQAGVSYVSVGHSRSLVCMHRQVLSIIGTDAAGGWQLQLAQEPPA